MTTVDTFNQIFNILEHLTSEVSELKTLLEADPESPHYCASCVHKLGAAICSKCRWNNNLSDHYRPEVLKESSQHVTQDQIRALESALTETRARLTRLEVGPRMNSESNIEVKS